MWSKKYDYAEDNFIKRKLSWQNDKENGIIHFNTVALHLWSFLLWGKAHLLYCTYSFWWPSLPSLRNIVQTTQTECNLLIMNRTFIFGTHQESSQTFILWTDTLSCLELFNWNLKCSLKVQSYSLPWPMKYTL